MTIYEKAIIDNKPIYYIAFPYDGASNGYKCKPTITILKQEEIEKMRSQEWVNEIKVIFGTGIGVYVTEDSFDEGIKKLIETFDIEQWYAQQEVNSYKECKKSAKKIRLPSAES